MRSGPARAAVVGLAAAALLLSACSSDGHRAKHSSRHSTSVIAAPPASTSTPAPTPTTRTPRPSPSRTHRVHRQSLAPSTPAHSTTAAHHNGSGRVIVLDPGHSVSVHATDKRTGLDVSDYENEPEMRDVWDVAQLVRHTLEHDGYRVVLTKKSLDDPASLGERAQIANDAHAALALSIHDQAGSNGGIDFRSGNNIVYYQRTGTYRSTASGKKVYFTDRSLAATSKKYGEIFRTQRQRVEDTDVRLQSDVGYDLGGRGLAGGNIWMVQLLSDVPWIYNESGGNSAGRDGLDDHDKQVYADGLVAAVEHCVP